MLTFAEFLTKRRAAFGMSMTELAARLSVTPQYISLLEAGRCNPSKKLQERCSKFFGEDVEYIRFLAQTMSRAQKEALLRSPTALPFLNRHGRELSEANDAIREAVSPDAEDLFVRQLFTAVENGQLNDESKAFYQWLIAEIGASTDGKPRFSAKARAWANLYDALLATDGTHLEPVASRFESLLTTLETDTNEPYPDELRLEVSRRLATARMQSGAFADAGAMYERVAHYARLTEDAEGALDAYRNAIEAYRRVGRLDVVLKMLTNAVGAEDIPAATRARLYVTKAQLLYDLGDSENAIEPVLQAVRIWRLRSLDIPDKTAQLVATQVLGLHLFVAKMFQVVWLRFRSSHSFDAQTAVASASTEARQWLGRIRSTLARVTEAEVPAGLRARYTVESDLESAALMIAQARWNHARKNIDAADGRIDDDVEFDDADDEALLRLRIMLMRSVVAFGQERSSDALEYARFVADAPPLSDPVRGKGRYTLLKFATTEILRACGDNDAADAVQAQLLAELDPYRQPTDALRSLCETDSIQRLRERIAASE
jgi:transcriptional regulator with XRE-family HTH domain